jgi:hypothetical protein
VELIETNLAALFALAVALIGVAQAVIGMMTKFNLKGYALLGSSAVVMVGLVLAVRYGWEYEALRLVLAAIIATLTSAGYWRYRNGEVTLDVTQNE